MSDAAPFDACGPLPTGLTVLEASAGTGKTFTIAALAARYVAQGIPIDRLLLVTFTRMATSELRERVRERLVGAEQHLARACAGGAPQADDEVLRLLAEGSAEEVERRRRRLAGALADFDAATIATTHGFCQHILSGLGVVGDVERDVSFVEDLRDLVEEVVDDLYIRRFQGGDAPPFSRAEAGRIGRCAVEHPFAPIEPTAAPQTSVPAMRRRLALAVRDEVERRKRRARVLTYDDLLGRLADTLADPQRGPAACGRLRERYRVALVDEFQDTDPVQWEIMQRAFGQDGATLVLIGDPKQAIYAFRGADVYAYLKAARSAGTRRSLAVNWRSDQGLVDAYATLFAGARLGHDGITYPAVRAADAHRRPRLSGAPCDAPLRLRVVRRDDGLVALTPKGWVAKASGQGHVAADLATDVVALLRSPAQVVSRLSDGAEAGREPVRPWHVAVLVRTNRQAALVRDALDTVNVPAVINGAGSVFATPVARQWLYLLEALERPAAATRARSAALTSFLGWTAEQIASADERAWEDVHARLHRWAGVLRRRGVASLLELLTRSERLPGRVLARGDGERQLTDLRHVGQLLHAQATAERLGVTALTAWLRARIAEADTDTSSEERSRRLESDAEAVQVLTIHRSKGLEFPIVYCPFLWDAGWAPKDPIPVFHDPDAGDRRTLDVGGVGGPGYARHRARYLEELRGEDLRLAYVALTRARHQAVLWWAASYDSAESPLGQLLFARGADGTSALALSEPPADDQALTRFKALAAAAPGRLSVERSTGPDGRAWTGGSAPRRELLVRGFDRLLDRTWRRTSYSAITAGAHDERVTSEPEEGGISDEAMPPPLVTPAGDDGDEQQRLRAVPSPLACLPGGAAIGTFVHAVLERTDFSAAELDGELAARVEEQLAWRRLEVGETGTVVAGLRAAIDTPLGPLADDLRLRDVARGDRLDELEFELPLAGGDVPTATATVDQIAHLLRVHLPSSDPLAGYADRLADPALRRSLRGYLAGSIDLVLRLRGAGRAQRFMVVDYKTNWLGLDGEHLSAWHYRPVALADAMQRAHYPLQALLYQVALHRYLRWRLPGYDPAHHLGGVLYLFLRGMTGPAVPRVADQPCGVFSWRPPPALVGALSDVLDRGAPP